MKRECTECDFLHCVRAGEFECRRNPPMRQELCEVELVDGTKCYYRHSGFPFVSPSTWCGEFLPIKGRVK
jgi:hypothetical protein